MDSESISKFSKLKHVLVFTCFKDSLFWNMKDEYNKTHEKESFFFLSLSTATVFGKLVKNVILIIVPS